MEETVLAFDIENTNERRRNTGESDGLLPQFRIRYAPAVMALTEGGTLAPLGAPEERAQEAGLGCI